MTTLIDLAADVMTSHGWATRREADLAKANLRFDMVAENETAIAFFELVESHNLRHRADALAGAIGAVTLHRNAGVKAWEAYLLLLVEENYSAADSAAQEIQRDLDYCRKIVLDGAAIVEAVSPATAMERALSFLFPLDVPVDPSARDVRTHLVEMISEKGFDPALVAELVDAFDREPDCKCWERVKKAPPQVASS